MVLRGWYRHSSAPESATAPAVQGTSLAGCVVGHGEGLLRVELPRLSQGPEQLLYASKSHTSLLVI